MAEKQKEVLQSSQSKSEGESKKEFLRQSKISLILNNYDDIFSDFDPRAYTDRALSHDFLLEAKNAARDKALGSVELSFLVPRDLRNHGAELVIKKRLHEHFKKHHDMIHREIKKIRRRGIKFSVVGAFLGIIATFFAVSSLNQILKNIFLILLEPASWFLIWTGFEHIFFIPQTKKLELEFYEKMLKAPISFQEY